MNVKHRRLSVAYLLAVLIAPALAHADLVSPPPPDCVDHPDGTQCILPNGTAGICRHNADTRRPGRTFITCEADSHECDRLAVGAVCHGYLSRPSHCREFTNATNHDHWRACMNDEVAATPETTDPPAPSRVDPTPAPAPVQPPQRVAVNDPPRPSTASGRCSAAPTQPSNTVPMGTLVLAASAIALLATRSRRAR